VSVTTERQSAARSDTIRAYLDQLGISSHFLATKRSMTDFDERPSLFLSRLTFSVTLLCLAPFYLAVITHSFVRVLHGNPPVASWMLCGLLLPTTLIAVCTMLRSGSGHLSRFGYLAGTIACLGPGFVFALLLNEAVSGQAFLDKLPAQVLTIAFLTICSIGALRFEQWYRHRDQPAVEEQRMLQWAGFFLLLTAVAAIQSQDLLGSLSGTLFFGLLINLGTGLLSGNRFAQTVVLCSTAFCAVLVSVPLCANASVVISQSDPDWLRCSAQLAASTALWGVASAGLSLAFHPSVSGGCGIPRQSPERLETLWTSWHV
jgi:hypothetical protein